MADPMSPGLRMGPRPTSRTVLICGGRDFAPTDRDITRMTDTLAALGATKILHGGASGADRFGGYVASRMGLPVEVFAADWRRLGRSAGPARNQRMLDEGRPDTVIALPGGRGTADMLRRVQAAGIEWIEWGPR